MKRLAAPAAIVLLAIGISFLPALRAKYTNWDDPEYVGAARQSLRGLCTSIVSGHYHPLTMLSLGLDYRLFGMNPTEMHVVNVALHALTSLLILWLLYELSGSVIGALAGALFFAIHPLRVESVAWISDRKDVLMGAFFAAALLTYLAHLRRGVSLGWTYLFFIFALLSKMTAVTLPFVLLLIDMIERGRPKIIDKIPMALISIGASLAAVKALRPAGAVPLHYVFNPFERVLLSAHALVMTISREIVPLNLSAYYLYKPVGAADWLSAAAILILAIAVIASVRRFPRIFSGIAFFVVAIGPMLPLMATGETIIADRYTYVPSIGLAFLVTIGVAALQARTAIAAIVAGSLLLGAMTWQRSAVWHDAHTLWLSVIDYDPAVPVAWNNLAVARMSDGDFTGGFYAIGRAIALNPCYILARRNRAQWFYDMQRYDLEQPEVEQMLRCRPNSDVAWEMKGNLLKKTGHLAEAELCFRRAREIRGLHLATSNR